MSQESQEPQGKEQCECVSKGKRAEHMDGKCWICYGKEMKRQHVQELWRNRKVNVPL